MRSDGAGRTILDMTASFRWQRREADEMGVGWGFPVTGPRGFENQLWLSYRVHFLRTGKPGGLAVPDTAESRWGNPGGEDLRAIFWCRFDGLSLGIQPPNGRYPLVDPQRDRIR